MMRPPFFIVEANGGVSAYDSAQAAETAVESVDVEDGEYRATYDADGRLLELYLATPTKRWRSRFLKGIEEIELVPVQLRPAEPEPSHQLDLRSALVADRGARVHVEAIAAERGTGADAVPVSPVGVVFHPAGDRIFLRLTAAVASKRLQHEKYWIPSNDAWRIAASLLFRDDPVFFIVAPGAAGASFVLLGPSDRSVL